MFWPDWADPRVRQLSFIVCAGALIAGGYILYERQNSCPKSSTIPSLRRSNAIRSRRRERHQQTRPLDIMDGAADHRQHESIQADDTLTDRAMDDVITAEVAEGQRLAELVYEIAKEKSEQEGIAHRGTYCDSCNISPIRGVRYHCSNCPDFDLCESCESRVEHIRTHVFYKIKIPAPWAHKIPQPSWYPGRPERLPSTLPSYIGNRLKEKVRPLLSHGQQENIENILKGYYKQFSCIANTQWQDAFAGLNMAINYNAFMQCVVDRAIAQDFPTPNLIHDRLFHFFDVDDDKLINFEEFVIGILLVQSSASDHKLERLFRAFDLDGDGYVTRKDFLRMFRAYYELNKSLLLAGLVNQHQGQNAAETGRGPNLSDVAYGGRPLASYFPSLPSQSLVRDPQLAQQGKEPNDHGDYVPNNELQASIITAPNTPLSRRSAVSRSWPPIRRYQFEELQRMMNKEPLRFLPSTHMNFAYDIPNEIRIGQYHNWALFQGAVYIKPIFFQSDFPLDSNDLFLRVYNYELRHDWRSKIHDYGYFLEVDGKVVSRLCEDIETQVNALGRSRLRIRSKRASFHLEDEKNSFNPDDDGEDDEDQQQLIGGSAAAHTIYLVTQQALNDLLDPAFHKIEIDIDAERIMLEPYQEEIDRLRVKIMSVMQQSREVLEILDFSQPHHQQQIDRFLEHVLSCLNIPLSPPSPLPFRLQPVAVSWEKDVREAWQSGRKDLLLEMTSMRNYEFVWMNVAADVADAPWRSMPDPRTNTMMDDFDMNQLLELDDAVKSVETGGGPGKLSFEQFKNWVNRTDRFAGEPDRLVKWVGSWLGLVTL